MTNWFLTIFSFRKTIITVAIVGILVTFLELESSATYVIAVFVSLIHPFYEKLGKINKNQHKERSRAERDAKVFCRRKIPSYIKRTIIVCVLALLFLVAIERWPSLIDWIIPKW